MTQHPNATAAGLTGAATVLAVYIASLFGLDVPAAVASAITTIAAGLVLLAGRRRPRPSPAPDTHTLPARTGRRSRSRSKR